MPTLNKLEYLDETKQEIKTALNTNFNSQITDEDTFRSYVSKIDNIYNNWPKVTGEGTEMTLSNVKKGKMPLQPKGNTEQDSYTGKNLYQVIGTTHNGLTGTLQSDGTLKISGKATHTSSNITTEMSTNLPAGTYTFSITKTVPFRVLLRGDNNVNIGVIQPGSTSQTFTTTSVNTTLKVFLYLLEVDTTYDEVIGVQLEAGSPATSFEPYVGGTASPNPDYPQDIRVVTGNNTIKVTGKNLFNLTNSEVSTNVTASITNNEVEFSWIGGFNLYLKDTLNLDSSKTYTISFKHKGDSVNLRNKGATQTLINTGINSDYTICSATITDITNFEFNFIRSVSGTGTAYIKDIQIEEGSTATSYQTYQGSNYTLNLGTTELCKIGDYQDYIYKQDGKFYKHKEIEKYAITGQENWTKSANYFFRVSDMFYDNKFVAGYGLCNQYVYNPTQSGLYASSSNNQFFLQYDRGYCNLFIRNDNYNDVSSWVSYLQSISNNILIYYPLETPIEEEITDTTLISQLEALNNAMAIDGTNNISSEYATGNAPVIISASALMKGGN